MLGILASRTHRAESAEEPVREYLVITRYAPNRVHQGEMLSLEDVTEILAVPLLGAIPESETVLQSSNAGVPVVLEKESEAGGAYADVVGRYLGEDLPHRFIEYQKKGFFSRLFGG